MLIKPMNQECSHQDEQGFVLATSLVMLMLMTMLSIAVYFGVSVSQKTSGVAATSTEAFYYAETAANYVAWAMKNNVEFDSYTYPQIVRTDLSGSANYSFGEPYARSAMVGNDTYTLLINPVRAGDYAEWRANRGNPFGDEFIEDREDQDVPGQLMYFDNSDLSTRVISIQDKYTYSSPDGGVTPAEEGFPSLSDIHLLLPRYIRLDIDSYGNITPALPPMPHGSVQGVDYPENGALVWVTGGNVFDDYALAPIDIYSKPVDTYSTYYDGLDTNPGDNQYFNCTFASFDGYSVACDRNSDTWLGTTDYGLIIYALSYVDGRASKLIRIVYVN